MERKTLEKMANTIIGYSLEVKAGETVAIYGEFAVAPLIEACYKEVLKKGANPIVQYIDPNLDKLYFELAEDSQLESEPIIAKTIYEKADCYLRILGSSDPDALKDADNAKQQKRILAQKSARDIYNRRVNEGSLRWCLCAYPTEANAKKIGMSEEEYSDFIVGATLCDRDEPMREWQKVHDEQEKIVEVLDKKSHIHIVSEGTDLTLSVAGRKWINSDGHHNFPSGEVFSAPVENSANGHITFSFPMFYMGKKIEGIYLEFTDGVVTNFDAKTGKDVLKTVLDVDEGAKRLGEVAVGTNYGITRFVGEMLFDEKIGGTMHLALGRAYSECGGVNESMIHMDMICDMKQGKIYFDGEVLYENGKFLF